MPKLLLVEDDVHQRELLRDLMLANGFDVTSVENLAQMNSLLGEIDCQIDVILLDLNLPDGDGLRRIAKLRQQLQCGLIVVSCRDGEQVRIEAIEQGADDFVCKPYSPGELAARVKSVISRIQQSHNKRVLRFKGWCVDQYRHEVTDPLGNFVDLTLSEYILWSEFLANPEQVLARDYLLDLFGNEFRDTSDRAIDSLVSRLRRKLGDHSKPPKIIETLRGKGYRFTGESPSH